MSSTDTFSLQVFDSETRPPEALISRKLVYLDSVAWIELAERSTDLAASCAAAVANGHVLFPLSHPAISELIEQPDRSQREVVADLMDRLSLGVSFRPGAAVELLEADAAFAVLLGISAKAPNPSRVLSWIGEYVGTAHVEFPNQWSKEDALKFIEHYRDHPSVRSVRWLVDNGPLEQMQESHRESKTRYVEKFSEAIARGAAAVDHLSGPARRKRLLREEWEWLVGKKLTPRIRDTLIDIVGIENLPEAVKALTTKLGEGSEQRLKDLMTVTPSLELTCEIMAARVSDVRRRVRPQDFHDVEHALLGAVYAQVFVTHDGGLMDLLRRCSVPGRRGCQILRLDDLPAVLGA